MSEVELKKYEAEILKIKIEVIHITLKNVILFGTIVSALTTLALLGLIK